MSLYRIDNTPVPTVRPSLVLAPLLGLAILIAALGPGRTAPGQALVTLNLTRYAKVASIDAGDYAGVSPGRIVVKVGQEVVFVNSDSRHHTATSLADASAFPENPQWTDSALRASGKIGEPVWSTGDLAPGARSAPIVATRAGTYLYGCFFDYSAGMRGEIVVEP